MLLKAKNSKEVVLNEDILNSAQNFILTGVDFENRTIDLIGDVCEQMEAIVARAVIKMQSLSEQPITIYLSTYGGDAYSGLAIYDLLKECPCDIIIKAKGKIMSAGTIIFLAGDYRYATKSTRFMVHSASSSVEGKVKDMDVDLAEAKFLNSEMIKVYTERTRMKNPKFWQKKLNTHDMYFGLTDANAYGMIKHRKVESNGTRVKSRK